MYEAEIWARTRNTDKAEVAPFTAILNKKNLDHGLTLIITTNVAHRLTDNGFRGGYYFVDRRRQKLREMSEAEAFRKDIKWHERVYISSKAAHLLNEEIRMRATFYLALDVFYIDDRSSINHAERGACLGISSNCFEKVHEARMALVVPKASKLLREPSGEDPVLRGLPRLRT
jgi:hypothetical protein